MNTFRACCLLLMMTIFFCISNAFLEFTLKRSEQKNISNLKDDCIGKNNFNVKDDDLQYDQLCYFKDIAYYIQLFYNHQLYHIAIDLTSPYSWLKGQQCTVSQTSKSCRLIKNNENKKEQSKQPQQTQISKVSNEKNVKKQEQSQLQSVDQKQQPTKKTRSKSKKVHSNGKLARIQGSNQFLEGYLQQNKQIQFWTKDSGRLSRLFDILMLGFYVLDQKQKVQLHKTNFINTTKLSQNMNELEDGALSLRFDQNSQNSFLQQIFQYIQTNDKIITIYINEKQSTLTIGQLSIKNSAQGYSGIVWVPFGETQDKTAYGQLPLVKQIMLQSVSKDQEQDIQKDNDNSIFVVFSLSASYIGLPQIAINSLIQQFKTKYHLQCQISYHSYLQCNSTSSHSKEKLNQQNLLIVMKQGSISLPLQSLILNRQKKKVTFNLRIISKEENEKSKSFIILGEPYFNKYFTVLDYLNNRVGFSKKRLNQHNNFISTISLIRFVSFLFFTGCCFLICFHPLKSMFSAFAGGRKFYSFNKKQPEGRRLKYEPIQQNPYQQIAGTLRKVLDQQEEKQVMQ